MGSQVELPEDILHQIHALMSLQDAARAACVSRSFLRSWRTYPKLILSTHSLCIKAHASKNVKRTRDFISRVDHILQNHSGMGVKLFSLDTYPCSNLHPNVVDRWLQVAVRPGIKEFKLSTFGCPDMEYNFPCSVLSSEQISSIRSFHLTGCSFHSAEQVSCMSSLINLNLYLVHVTGEELYGLLSNCGALETFRLINCEDIIYLKIPCLLQRLRILEVFGCTKLETIESNAPKLSTFSYSGRPIHISLGDASQVTKVSFGSANSSGSLCYASTKLPFIAPNLRTLDLATRYETVNTPIAFGKFLKLKYLEIKMFAPRISPDYDFYSLDSFLDVSPALETFVLHIVWLTITNDSDDDSLHPRRLSECCYGNLKNVTITGFCSSQSMVEFTLRIIEKSKLLKCLTLDTTRGHDKAFVKTDKCLWMNKDEIAEAKKACVSIRRYIKWRVPSAVNLNVIKPCSECRCLL